MDLFGFSVPLWMLLTLGLMVTYYKYITWHATFFERLGVRHRRSFPVLHAFWNIFRKGIALGDFDYRLLYGKVYGTFFSRQPILMVGDPEMLKEIMVKKFNSFQNRQPFDLKGDIAEKMILFLTDDHWKHVRTLMTPTFSGSKLRRMMVDINRCARDLKDSVAEKANNGQSFEFFTLAGNYTMDVIASTGFGIHINSQKEPDSPFVKHAKHAFVTDVADLRLVILVFFPFLTRHMGKMGYSIFPKDATDFFSKVVKGAANSRENKPSEGHKDFLQLLINAQVEDPADQPAQAGHNGVQQKQDLVKDTSGLWSKSGLTEEEIVAQSLIFFFAGYETTAVTISYMAYNLATNPDCQERLYSEISEVTAGQDIIDYDVVKKMPYLDMCIDETLRLFPPGARIDRVASDDVIVKGVHIPKGTVVGIPIYSIHHDPDLWEDPETFNPERFTPEAKAERDPFVYMPFGMGPRNCIGMRLALMEVKVAMTQVLRDYKLVTCAETEIPVMMMKAAMRPANGVTIKAQARA